MLCFDLKAKRYLNLLHLNSLTLLSLFIYITIQSEELKTLLWNFTMSYFKPSLIRNYHQCHFNVLSPTSFSHDFCNSLDLYVHNFHPSNSTISHQTCLTNLYSFRLFDLFLEIHLIFIIHLPIYCLILLVHQLKHL